MRNDNLWEDSTSCLGWVILLIVLLALGIFLGPAIELWIWDTVFIPVFNAPVLDYWQMFAINLFVHLIIPTSTNISSKR